VVLGDEYRLYECRLRVAEEDEEDEECEERE